MFCGKVGGIGRVQTEIIIVVAEDDPSWEQREGRKYFALGLLWLHIANH